MEPLRVLTVTFDTPIQPWQIRSLRGAIAQKVGWQHDLFHNHHNGIIRESEDEAAAEPAPVRNKKYHYRYPLIQYKCHRQKPLLLCLNEGVEEMHHFFSQPDWSVQMNDQDQPLRIEQFAMHEYDIRTRSKSGTYHLRQWLPLNEENYQRYNGLESLLDRIAMLEVLLRNHLVAFCYGIGLDPEAPITATILELKDQRWIKYKEARLLALSLTFRTNLILPDFIGLGKGVSVGWGIVRKLKQ